ncbi:MAG TPA: PqqD family protein [Polyangia bacterium]|nr:PqqD family protein [Polyangia bacterium]
MKSGDGVIVDLESGNFFRLNQSAVTACRELLACKTTLEAVERLADHLHIPLEQAESFIASVQTLLVQAGIRSPAASPLRYTHETEDLCTFSENDKRIFSIHLREKSLELCASPGDLRAPLVFYVRAVLPKLLALNGVPILHGAACRTSDSFVAFCGVSGAGKTTTALSFRDAGASVLSEDLLVLSVGQAAVEVHEDGERTARAWAAEAAEHLSKQRRIGFSDLAAVTGGTTRPLTTIWFLEATRRSGDRFLLHPLSPLEGLLLLLGNGFLASVDPIQWRGFLHRSVLIAESTTMRALTAPAGLENLAAAARAYSLNSAS